VVAADEPRRRGDTRERIREVAMELFAEQGYDKTSLREIAERLGVTKAALYYHFKSKEDIVASAFDDFLAEVERIVAWGQEQPRTAETRRELVRRYSRLVRGKWTTIVRFVQENQTAVRELRSQEALRARFIRLARLLTIPDAPPALQLKSRIALITLQAGPFITEDLGMTERQRHDLALQVALELVSGE
jgi:AcrR family transcriptional regulator